MDSIGTSSAVPSSPREVPPSSVETPAVTHAPKREANEDSKPKKKQRFTKPIAGRRGGAAYSKQTPTTSLQIVPRRPYFPIFVSNLGCHHLVSAVYNVIRGRDHRLAQSVTLPQLEYVTCLSFCNRLVQCALHHGTAFPLGASRLNQVAKNIQLPAVIATYVECFGSFELASGAKVIPYVGDYRELFPLGSDQMLDPVQLLGDDFELVGDWPINVDWIIDYNASTTRAARTGIDFRCVDNTSYVGRAEMLVSYIELGDVLVLPKAPQRMSTAEAELGAAYRIRDYARRLEWPGTNAELLYDAFTTIPCDPRVVVSDICVAAFKGFNQSK